MKAAFTYLELLLALTLFSVGVLSVIKIFPTNRKFLAQSANTTQAVFLAQEEIESIRAVPYGSLTVGTYEPLEYLGTGPTDPFYQYQRTTTVDLLDTNWNVTVTDGGLKRIIVTVSWAERGVNRSYTLTTYAYNH